MTDSRPTSESRATDPQSGGGERARALADIVFNSVLAVGFALLYWQSGHLPSSMWEPLGARSFPRLALGGLIVFNLIVIVVQFRKLAVSPALARGAVTGWLWQHRLAFALLGLFLGYVIAIHWLGFAWASLLFLLAGQITLGARSPRALIIALIIAGVFSFGIDALFGQVFNIMLPTGALFR